MTKPQFEATRRSRIARQARSLLPAIVVALLFRSLVAQAYFIPSESMEPTLQVGDHIIANKILYQLRAPAPGEIVIFDHPQEHGTDLIKRVVATGGDWVKGSKGRVWVNGVAKGPSEDFSERVVPRDNLFVMGDNRFNSNDSRYWGFVPIGLVRGRAEVIVWGGEGKRVARMLRLIR